MCTFKHTHTNTFKSVYFMSHFNSSSVPLCVHVRCGDGDADGDENVDRDVNVDVDVDVYVCMSLCVCVCVSVSLLSLIWNATSLVCITCLTCQVLFVSQRESLYTFFHILSFSSFRVFGVKFGKSHRVICCSAFSLSLSLSPLTLLTLSKFPLSVKKGDNCTL